MRAGLFLLLFGYLLTTQAQTTQYVTDELKLPVRKGTSTSHRIIKMLPSGTPVTVLKTTSQGYSQIRTATGATGWMLSRHLTREPSARNRVAKAEATAATLTQQNQALTAELDELRNTTANSDQRYASLSNRERELAAELDAIRRTSAGALQLAEQNQVLKRELLERDKQVQTLTQESATARERTDQQWFIIGAIVVLVSIFLGHLLPRMRLRKGSNLDSF